MTNELRVMIETGPKGKKVVARAQDWPGLVRGAKTEDAALERMLAYVPRYAPVAALAGMDAEYATNTNIDVIERYTGTGSTDFWGISFGFSSIDKQAISDEALERDLALLRACWTFFDDVRSRVSAELQRGPRGGGRDRDQIVRHTLEQELNWAPKLHLQYTMEDMLTDAGLAAHREAYCSDIRELHDAGKMAGKWPLRFLVRHTAYHTLDHAWEMEDKDLSAKPA